MPEGVSGCAGRTGTPGSARAPGAARLGTVGGGLGPAGRPGADDGWWVTVSFDSTNGTRGARQPEGPFLKWMNSLVAGRIARKGKAPGMKFDALVLVTRGAKSGEERRSPLGWFPGTDGSWLVVAAAAGAPKNPAWYYNLRAHPDDVSIEVPGGPVAVRAGQLHGAEREEAWRQIVAASAQFGGYQDKTDRELPVIRLVRRAA